MAAYRLRLQAFCKRKRAEIRSCPGRAAQTGLRSSTRLRLRLRRNPEACPCTNASRASFPSGSFRCAAGNRCDPGGRGAFGAHPPLPTIAASLRPPAASPLAVPCTRSRRASSPAPARCTAPARRLHRAVDRRRGHRARRGRLPLCSRLHRTRRGLRQPGLCACRRGRRWPLHERD